MKAITIRHLSFTGLLLFIVSAITAAVLPGNSEKKTNNGHLVVTSDGGDNSCQFGFQTGTPCTYTRTLAHDVSANCGIGSRTSAVQVGDDTSTITTTLCFNHVISITQGADNVEVRNIDTSADEGL